MDVAALGLSFPRKKYPINPETENSSKGRTRNAKKSDCSPGTFFAIAKMIKNMPVVNMNERDVRKRAFDAQILRGERGDVRSVRIVLFLFSFTNTSEESITGSRIANMETPMMKNDSGSSPEEEAINAVITNITEHISANLHIRLDLMALFHSFIKRTFTLTPHSP